MEGSTVKQPPVAKGTISNLQDKQHHHADVKTSRGDDKAAAVHHGGKCAKSATWDGALHCCSFDQDLSLEGQNFQNLRYGNHMKEVQRTRSLDYLKLQANKPRSPPSGPEGAIDSGLKRYTHPEDLIWSLLPALSLVAGQKWPELQRHAAAKLAVAKQVCFRLFV